jgi:hypothetical protein
VLTLRPGTRVLSAIDQTELVVVRAPADPIDLTVGGVPAVVSAEKRGTGTPISGHDTGISVGKRYVDGTGTVELLCTKAGTGVPAIAGELLTIKRAKPLPASD